MSAGARAAACPSCGAEIALDEAALAARRGACAACGKTFELGPEAVLGDGPLRLHAAAELIAVLEDPPGRLARRADAATGVTTLTLRPHRGAGAGLLVFSLFWWGFLIVWYLIALATDGPLLMLVGPLLHVAAGVFLVWQTLWLSFGREEIRVGPQGVEVRRGVGPAVRRQALPAARYVAVRLGPGREVLLGEGPGRVVVARDWKLAESEADWLRRALLEALDDANTARTGRSQAMS